MDPQSNDTPGLRLPQPSMHQGPAQQAPTVSMPPEAPEVQAMVQPSMPIIQPQSQAAEPHIQHYQPPVQPLPSGAYQQAALDQPPALPSRQPAAVAAPQPITPQPEAVTVGDGDEDAADEEWIAKAKAAAEQYRSDPYALSNALSKIKADYMMSRHGKMVKTNNSNT